jgi:hypothetical protein
MLPGFFAAALITAKRMPVQLFKAEMGDDSQATSDPGIKKPLN